MGAFPHSGIHCRLARHLLKRYLLAHLDSMRILQKEPEPLADSVTAVSAEHIFADPLDQSVAGAVAGAGTKAAVAEGR